MRVGYYANADRPASRGFGDGFFGGQSPMLLLSARDFTFEAEASTSYLLRFDTAAWDAQNIPIWLQEELTDRVIGSSQTLTRLYGTAFIDPLLPTGFKRGVFVVAVDSEPVKPNLMGPAVPIFLTPGPHTIDVIDVSTGWEQPKCSFSQAMASSLVAGEASFNLSLPMPSVLPKREFWPLFSALKCSRT
jgi:hypothetical protein